MLACLSLSDVILTAWLLQQRIKMRLSLLWGNPKPLPSADVWREWLRLHYCAKRSPSPAPSACLPALIRESLSTRPLSLSICPVCRRTVGGMSDSSAAPAQSQSKTKPCKRSSLHSRTSPGESRCRGETDRLRDRRGGVWWVPYLQSSLGQFGVCFLFECLFFYSAKWMQY